MFTIKPVEIHWRSLNEVKVQYKLIILIEFV